MKYNKNTTNSEKLQNLSVADFEEIFDDTLSPYVRDKISEYNFNYKELSAQDKKVCIKNILDILMNSELGKAGKKRIEQWEAGWGENLQEFEASLEMTSILPKYFGKYDILRLKQKFIRPESKNFEANSLKIILDWLFDKYFRFLPTVYEFGCGTGHNLLQVRNVNKTATLWGLDWTRASGDLINKIANEEKDSNLFAHQFNFFEPDGNFKLDKNGAIYTVAALEQVGNNHNAFIKYLIKQKPALCIHVEPIAELLDEENLLDWLSLQYFDKRNYLEGYLYHLQELEKEGKIQILKAQRSYIGSLFIDGYSIVIWKPL